MSKQHCPHCQALQEINHNDGYGYEEERRHSQQCYKCLNIFWFETIISISYFIFKNEEGDE